MENNEIIINDSTFELLNKISTSNTENLEELLSETSIEPDEILNFISAHYDSGNDQEIDSLKNELITISIKKASVNIAKYFDKIVLIIEEENEFEGLKSVLLENNLPVVMASSPEVALDMVNNNDIGIVLLDIEMPSMNGIELAKNIKAKFHGMPIIAQVGTSMSHGFGIQENIDDYIIKSFDENIKIATIQKNIISQFF